MTKIALLGNYATQFFRKSLFKVFKNSDCQTVFYESDYNTIDIEIINSDSELYTFKPDFIIIHESDLGFKNEFYKIKTDDKVRFHLDKIQNLENRIQIISNLLPNCKIIYPSLFLENDLVYGNYFSKSRSSWFYQVNKYNVDTIDLALKYHNLIVLDSFSYVPVNIVKRNFYLVNSADLHFTLDYLDWLASATMKLIESYCGKFVKCVILDLDNTLWGGIIGDDGINGIQIGDTGFGKAFYSLQKWLKELKNRGVILAVCSKNEDMIAKQPFLHHTGMVLKLDDFAVFIANWNSKADNINQIKEILNISFDSIVFIDDNPAEREIVKQYIQGIIVPDLPDDTSDYLPFLISLNLFETASISENDQKRTLQYQEEAKRVQFAKSITNMEDFLKSLEMKAIITNFKESDYERLAQLSQRSNQYNLRTVRYSSQDIKEISLSSDYKTFSISIQDKFGDYGLISMVIIKFINNHEAFIDTWIMSCRVLKRTVEILAMNYIVDVLRENNISKIKGEYLPTPKNKLVKTFFPEFGFSAEKDDSNKFFLDLSNYKQQKTYIS